MVWAEESAPERLQSVVSAHVLAQPDKPSVPDLESTGHTAGSSNAALHVKKTTSKEKWVGDGRAGFWIIGILINLSVLTWFLIWAIKEWRKIRR